MISHFRIETGYYKVVEITWETRFIDKYSEMKSDTLKFIFFIYNLSKKLNYWPFSFLTKWVLTYIGVL